MKTVDWCSLPVESVVSSIFKGGLHEPSDSVDDNAWVVLAHVLLCNRGGSLSIGKRNGAEFRWSRRAAFNGGPPGGEWGAARLGGAEVTDGTALLDVVCKRSFPKVTACPPCKQLGGTPGGRQRQCRV